MNKIIATSLTFPFQNKMITLTSLSVLSFGIPLVLGHSQILTGILVNMTLFIAATTLPIGFILPIALFPSLAVLSKGIIFGPFTPFLVYFIPCIWIGNFLLIQVFKRLQPNFNYGLRVVSASIIKGLFLYFFANIFFSLHIVPKIFMQTMGINQVITAILGGLFAWPIIKNLKDGTVQ